MATLTVTARGQVTFRKDVLQHLESAWLGGETFVSFDKKAVSLIARQGRQARLLA